MSAEPLRVFLATKFPVSYIEGTIVPKLRDLGIAVERVIPVDYEGQIRDVGAVLFMFQMTSHSDHDNLKDRCKSAGVPFVLLERQSANWPHVLRKAGLKFPGVPVYLLPLPSTNGKPLLPPPRPVEPEPEEASPAAPEPEKRPFVDVLCEELQRQKLKDTELAAMLSVSAGLVYFWRKGKPIARGDYDSLCNLIPALRDAALPTFTVRTRTRVQHIADPAPVVSMTPVELPLPAKATNGHKATPPPLAGLLRAARALGIEGKLTVEVDDGASVVRIGDKAWHGTSPDAAVETARASLDKRLAEAMRRMEEQQRAMAAAMAEIGGAV